MEDNSSIVKPVEFTEFAQMVTSLNFYLLLTYKRLYLN
jgi:hypothetical protein